MAHWSLTTLSEKLDKIGARIVRHGTTSTGEVCLEVEKTLDESDTNLFDIGSVSCDSALPQPIDLEFAVKDRNRYVDARN